MKIISPVLMFSIAAVASVGVADPAVQCASGAERYAVGDVESLGFSCPNGVAKILSSNQQGNIITYETTVICDPKNPIPMSDEVAVNANDCSLH